MQLFSKKPKVKDAEKGPYVKSQIQALWEKAEITADALYYCEGMDEWKPLLEFMEKENAESNTPVAALPPSPLPAALPAAAAALPPAHGKDEVFFNDNMFTVTKTRFITPGQTYSMRNITSVKHTKSPPQYFSIVCCVLFGLMFSLMGFVGGAGAGILTLAIVGTAEFFLIKWIMTPIYEVCLITTAGEASALTSKNRQYTGKIVTALNKAISQQ